MCPFSFRESMSQYELKDKKGVHNKYMLYELVSIGRINFRIQDINQ